MFDGIFEILALVGFVIFIYLGVVKPFFKRDRDG
jgi:hypothetical protein